MYGSGALRKVCHLFRPQLGRGKGVELQAEHLPRLVHQAVHRRQVQGGRLEHVIRRPGLKLQPQPLPLLAKGRARQDRKGKAHHPRPAVEDLVAQAPIAQRVGQVGGQQLDAVVAFQPPPPDKQRQIARRQRHVAAHRLRTRRRNRKLYQQNQRAVCCQSTHSQL
ncbi:MAG: hypothetical protein ABSF26_25660 [Thermoguttaceae bacterium]